MTLSPKTLFRLAIGAILASLLFQVFQSEDGTFTSLPNTHVSCISHPSIHMTHLPHKGYARSGINLAIYRRHALLSVKDKQLINYLGKSGEIRLVARTLTAEPDAEISIPNPMPSRMLGDGHQGINTGYSADNFVHLIFGAHGTTPFYYRVQWPDLIVSRGNPTDLKLSSHLITYPQFYEFNNQLILLYRDDVAKTYGFSRYNVDSHEWQSWLTPLFITPDNVSSVYLNNLGIYGTTIAIAYTVRYPDTTNPQNPKVLNEHFRIIYSEDGGTTWRTSNGIQLVLPIPALAPPVTINIPQENTLINQAGAWLGADRIYRVAYYANGAHAIPQIFVSEFDLVSQRIQTSQVTRRLESFALVGRGSLSLPISRPTIFEFLNRVIVIYRENDEVIAAWKSLDQMDSNWNHLKLCRGSLKNWEPIIDFNQLARGYWSLFLQGAEQGNEDTIFDSEIESDVILFDLSQEAIKTLMPIPRDGHWWKK
jgi:hypothetical protein